jgi:TRAP-type C4-dicarboxylate transport system substrate-binding protein
MQSKTRLGVLASMLALYVLTGAGAAVAQTFEFKATLFPPPQNPLVKGFVEWVERLKEKSNGRIDIKVFPASQMGPPPRQFDLVRTGVADFGIVLHGLTPGRFPLMELTHVPGVLKAKSNYGGALALTSLSSQFAAEHPGVKIINVLVTKTFIISRNQIKTAADLTGKRVRAAGSVQSDVLRAMGAVPTLVQPGDMNDALEKGMVEGISTAYSAVASYKLDDVAKFVAEGDMGYVSFATVMNQKAYDSLPADLKKILDENSDMESAKIAARVLNDDEAQIRSDLIKRSVKVAPLADETPLMKAADQILGQAIKKTGAGGVDGKKLVDEINAASARYGGQM